MNIELPWLILSAAFLIAGLSVFAGRSGIAAPILMLVAGIAFSFVPGVPEIVLEPDLVLLLLLPPLLYASGVGMSWKGFHANLRPILLLSVGCVLFTALGVAAITHYALGMPWAVGFVLGAIVSPPDAVAPMAIARRLGLPTRLLTVLEGESLVNDATALVILSFAVAAVATGDFSLTDAAMRFALIVTSELVFGIAVGWAMLRLRHLADDPRAEILLSLATPFVAFWPPHELGGSGVIACVAAGLWVSWNGRSLIRPATRLQGFFAWGLVTWVIEALVFLLTGTQARGIITALAGEDWDRLLGIGLLVSLTVIVVRFIWVFPATYVPRVVIPGLARRDPHPNWRMPFMVAFTGLRGVVSLAAALSIPETLNGAPFPYRDLLLFLTFCVIVVTLVGLGGLMPWIIGRLGLERTGHAEALDNKRAEQAARIAALDTVLARVDAAEAAGEPPQAVSALRQYHGIRRSSVLPGQSLPVIRSTLHQPSSGGGIFSTPMRPRFSRRAR